MTSIPGWSRTGPDIVSEIEMASTNWTGPFLIVEGASDECFFSTRVPESVYIIEASGKRNVEAAFDILDSDASHAATLALGIVDEDYDWLTGHTINSPNIIKQDPRDLEGMLVRSNGLRAVLAEYGDRNAIRHFESTQGPVLDALLTRAEFFGRVRMFNALNNKVCLKKFKPQRFCDVSNWSYDHLSALDVAVGMGVHHDAYDLGVQIGLIESPSMWHVARGHDLIDILVGGLIGVFGASGNVSTRDVERLLRQSMQAHEFHGSGVFLRVSAWQVAKGASWM